MRMSGVDSLAPDLGCKSPAGARVKRHVVRRKMRRRCRCGRLANDLCPAAEAFVEQPAVAQRVQHLPVLTRAYASDCTRTSPSQSRPEPVEVLQDGPGVVLAAALRVDVLESQQEAASGGRSLRCQVASAEAA